jgi:hypothetical protein
MRIVGFAREFWFAGLAVGHLGAWNGTGTVTGVWMLCHSHFLRLADLQWNKGLFWD